MYWCQILKSNKRRIHTKKIIGPKCYACLLFGKEETICQFSLHCPLWSEYVDWSFSASCLCIEGGYSLAWDIKTINSLILMITCNINVEMSQSKALRSEPHWMTIAISNEKLVDCLKFTWKSDHLNTCKCLLKTLVLPAFNHYLERGKEILFALGSGNCWWSTSPKHFPFFENRCTIASKSLLRPSTSTPH